MRARPTRRGVFWAKWYRLNTQKLWPVFEASLKGGASSETLREAIKLLISLREPLKLRRLQPILEELGMLQPSQDEKVGTELILRLEETAE